MLCHVLGITSHHITSHCTVLGTRVSHVIPHSLSLQGRELLDLSLTVLLIRGQEVFLDIKTLSFSLSVVLLPKVLLSFLFSSGVLCFGIIPAALL